MKNCSMCHRDKPKSEFHKGANEGLAAYCIECMHIYYASRYNRKTSVMFKSKTQKQCRMCLEIKAKTDFPTYKNGVLHTYCRTCTAAYSRKRTIEKHGITVSDYAKMLSLQKGLCAICKRPSRVSLSIDHDLCHCDNPHGCSECVRGLVCSLCNRAMGLVDDRLDILESMIAYLKNPPGI